MREKSSRMKRMTGSCGRINRQRGIQPANEASEADRFRPNYFLAQTCRPP